MYMTQTARNVLSAHSSKRLLTHFLRDFFSGLHSYSILCFSCLLGFLVLLNQKQEKTETNIKKALPLLCTHSDAALNQLNPAHAHVAETSSCETWWAVSPS